MAVDLAKMVAVTKDFQAEQLEVFGKFVDNSKAVISTLDSAKAQADEQFKTMDGKVQEMASAPTSGSDKPAIEELKYEPEYTDVLDKVTLEEVTVDTGDKRNPKVFSQYVDDKATAITTAMDERQKAS